MLAEELGIEPSGELRLLEQQILTQAAPDGAPHSIGSRDEPDRREAERRVLTILAV